MSSLRCQNYNFQLVLPEYCRIVNCFTFFCFLEKRTYRSKVIKRGRMKAVSSIVTVWALSDHRCFLEEISLLIIRRGDTDFDHATSKDIPHREFRLLLFSCIWVPIVAWADYFASASLFLLVLSHLQLLLRFSVQVEVWLLKIWFEKCVQCDICACQNFTCIRNFSNRMGGSVVAPSQKWLDWQRSFRECRVGDCAISYRLSIYIKLCFCSAKSNIVVCMKLGNFAVPNHV